MLFRRTYQRTHQIDPALRAKVLKRDKYKCRYCGSPFEPHVDHVKPRSKGGKDTMKNLVTACASCNLSKSDRSLSGIRTKTKIRRFGKERKKLVKKGGGYKVTQPRKMLPPGVILPPKSTVRIRVKPRRHWWALWIK